MSNTLPLYRLQQIDSRLSQVTTRLATIQSLLENNAELKAASQQLEAAKSTHRLAEQDLKNAEYESSQQRIKLEMAESSLYGGRIQNPKELRDLQNDIASLKRHLSVLEDKQLELMMAVEISTEAQAKAQKVYDLTQGKIVSQNATLQTEFSTLEKEADKLNAQRFAVLPAINEADLGLYNSLRQRRSGMAVSLVIENACDTCGSSLTPGFAQSVRTSSQLVLCPMCGRILYSN
jgi:predicted  nucleic acid-binding Zn-ribbon protein